MDIEWIPEALHEYEAAVGYYEERSDCAPAQLADEVAAAIAFIRERPQRLPLRRGGYRRMNLAKFHYHIPYIVEPNMVWIMALAHNRRRPEYWISRQRYIP